MRLDGFRPGTVRDVSASVGAWLIANRYADPEMRRSDSTADDGFCSVKDGRESATDHPHRRATDR
jgi:hypothetical protein